MTSFLRKPNSQMENSNHANGVHPAHSTLIAQAKPNTRASPIRFIDLSSCTQPKHLPPQFGKFKGRKTLVLDLDETLVHSTFQDEGHTDIDLPVDFENQIVHVYVNKRPGLASFLQRMCKIYEVVIFTASLSNYANPLMDILDPNSDIPYRLFRDECIFSQGGYIKDLRILERDLKNVIIVDNSPISYAYQIQNGLPITSWFDDMKDIELTNYVSILEMLSKSESPLDLISKLVDGTQINYKAVARCLKTEREKELQKEEAKKLEVKNSTKSEARINRTELLINSIYSQGKKNITGNKVNKRDKLYQHNQLTMKKLLARLQPSTARSQSKSHPQFSNLGPVHKKSVDKSTTYKTPPTAKQSNNYSPPKQSTSRPLFTNLIKMSLYVKDKITRLTPTPKNKCRVSINKLVCPNQSRSNSQTASSQSDELRNALNINSPKRIIAVSITENTRPKSSVSHYLKEAINKVQLV